MTDRTPSVKHIPARKRPHFLGVWLSDSAKQTIDEQATKLRTSRSEVVRRMLAYAVWKMPPGWRP